MRFDTYTEVSYPVYTKGALPNTVYGAVEETTMR